MPSIRLGDRIYHVTDIDRAHCPRVVPMKVLVLGLCRTGTEWLIELQHLSSYHGYHALITNSRNCEIWLKGLRSKCDGIGKPFGRAEFDKLLGHCQLVEAYPEAEVISTVSIMRIVRALGKDHIKYIMIPLIRAINILTFSRFRWVILTFEKAGLGMFTEPFEQRAREIYSEHYKMIQSLVPVERLLKYHVKEGWEPLCTFLEQPIPEAPIPNINLKAEMQMRSDKCTLFMLKECAVTEMKSAVCLFVAGFLLKMAMLDRFD
ncbi:hypothetical protein BDV36DRAFT_285992 [Aspergillus pseudocaelatus]|uniref:P-loop containing nucleoside triphosphate hydrolase protein n=1 Tax=Aspergillus pseudocaelatus TaxID=1825620 RepID=A0ABQ6WC25_9EURO|nr:hypothetical protein BDV36DRAFT_285992 [Aspergillus pseudocaelatus]